jgi:hypothetical protein
MRRARARRKPGSIAESQCPDREIQGIEFRVNQHTNYLKLV